MSFHPNSIIPEMGPPRRLNECAQCGEQPFAPERSEYFDYHRVRNLWECEACGHAYETTVSFARSAA